MLQQSIAAGMAEMLEINVGCRICGDYGQYITFRHCPKRFSRFQDRKRAGKAGCIQNLGGFRQGWLSEENDLPKSSSSYGDVQGTLVTGGAFLHIIQRLT